MARRKYLSQKQLTVLDDLFGGDLDEQEVLDKHKVRRNTYDRWLADKLFAERFKQYVNGLKRRSELLMAKYSCLAARKACLDIISLPKRAAKDAKQGSGQQSDDEPGQQLPQQTASRLLAALADEK